MVVSGITRSCLPCDLWAWTGDLAVFFNEFPKQALENEIKLHFGFLQNSSNMFCGTECIGQNAMNNSTPFIENESRNIVLFTDYTPVSSMAKKSFVC